MSIANCKHAAFKLDNGKLVTPAGFHVRSGNVRTTGATIYLKWDEMGTIDLQFPHRLLAAIGMLPDLLRACAERESTSGHAESGAALDDATMPNAQSGEEPKAPATTVGAAPAQEQAP